MFVRGCWETARPLARAQETLAFFVSSTKYYFSRTRKTASSFMTSDLSTPGTRQSPLSCPRGIHLRGLRHSAIRLNTAFLTGSVTPSSSFCDVSCAPFPLTCAALPSPVDPVATRAQGPFFHARSISQTHSHTSQNRAKSPSAVWAPQTPP